jgi:hypothetical protein
MTDLSSRFWSGAAAQVLRKIETRVETRPQQQNEWYVRSPSSHGVWDQFLNCNQIKNYFKYYS